MNKRDIIFEYILHHGIDNYALKNMLQIRRAELERREPFFQTVEIGGLCRLLSYRCDCNLTMRSLTERKVIADKGMLCALVFNIVNRLASPLSLTLYTHKNFLAITLKGNFNYCPNAFEKILFKKLKAACSFLQQNNKSVLVLKFMKGKAKPTAYISAEELLLNPLSDAYVFFNNM